MNNMLHIRMQNELVESMDEFVDTGMYTNRTEFIKEAVRKLVFELKKQWALAEIKKQRGMFKGVAPDQITPKMREKIFEEFCIEKGFK